MTVQTVVEEVKFSFSALWLEASQQYGNWGVTLCHDGD